MLKNRYVRDGYRFTGWNTAEDGSGDPYEDKAMLSWSADTMLYAQWEEID